MLVHQHCESIGFFHQRAHAATNILLHDARAYISGRSRAFRRHDSLLIWYYVFLVVNPHSKRHDLWRTRQLSKRY